MRKTRTLAELRRAARMGHEIVLFQILSREEIESAVPARSRVRRSGDRPHAGDQRRAWRGAAYTDAMAAFLERWHSRAGAEGFQYSLIITDTPPARALRQFLLARVARSMFWLNPSALFALAAIAAPILIHILVQRRAERFPFPTLRFLQPTRLAAIRRHLLEDLPLLAIRDRRSCGGGGRARGTAVGHRCQTPRVGQPARAGDRDRRRRDGRGHRIPVGQRQIRRDTATTVRRPVASGRHPPRDPVARDHAAGAAGDRDRVGAADRFDHAGRRGGHSARTSACASSGAGDAAGDAHCAGRPAADASRRRALAR